MTRSIVAVAAKAWTHWFAPVLLISALLHIAGIAVGYYQGVAVPASQWRLHEEQRRLAEPRRHPGTVHRLPEHASLTSSAEAA